jgi:hypothetical protein
VPGASVAVSGDRSAYDATKMAARREAAETAGGRNYRPGERDGHNVEREVLAIATPSTAPPMRKRRGGWKATPMASVSARCPTHIPSGVAAVLAGEARCGFEPATKAL